MDRIEELEKNIAEFMSYVKKEIEEIKKEVSKNGKQKPKSLKLHKTSFKVKNSRYNNGSKIVIVEKGEESIAFALNREDWLKLREFLDSYFNSGNGSQPAKKSYNKKSYGNGSYTKKSKAVAVEEVEGYENALEEITFCIDSIYDLAMDIHTYRLKEKHSNQLGSGSYERATANKL